MLSFSYILLSPTATLVQQLYVYCTLPNITQFRYGGAPLKEHIISLFFVENIISLQKYIVYLGLVSGNIFF
jgi:hypothetical protein